MRVGASPRTHLFTAWCVDGAGAAGAAGLAVVDGCLAVVAVQVWVEVGVGCGAGAAGQPEFALSAGQLVALLAGLLPVG